MVALVGLVLVEGMGQGDGVEVVEEVHLGVDRRVVGDQLLLQIRRLP